jgi:hypothetical protein
VSRLCVFDVFLRKEMMKKLGLISLVLAGVSFAAVGCATNDGMTHPETAQSQSAVQSETDTSLVSAQASTDISAQGEVAAQADPAAQQIEAAQAAPAEQPAAMTDATAQ